MFSPEKKIEKKAPLSATNTVEKNKKSADDLTKTNNSLPKIPKKTADSFQ